MPWHGSSRIRRSWVNFSSLRATPEPPPTDEMSLFRPTTFPASSISRKAVSSTSSSSVPNLPSASDWPMPSPNAPRSSAGTSSASGLAKPPRASKPQNHSPRISWPGMESRQRGTHCSRILARPSPMSAALAHPSSSRHRGSRRAKASSFPTRWKKPKGSCAPSCSTIRSRMRARKS